MEWVEQKRSEEEELRGYQREREEVVEILNVVMLLCGCLATKQVVSSLPGMNVVLNFSWFRFNLGFFCAFLPVCFVVSFLCFSLYFFV